MDPHDRRLTADARKLSELAANSDLIEVSAVDGASGRPPEIWEITYRCRGVIGADPDGTPTYGYHHRVRIELGREYPNQPPLMRWLTPILHPNIEGHEPHRVCINQAQWQAGQTLDQVVLMIGEMVQYKNYHAESTPPWPLDRAAAEWALHAERAGHFSKTNPVDPRPLLRPDTSASSRLRPPTDARPRRITVRTSTTPPAQPQGSRVRIAGPQP